MFCHNFAIPGDIAPKISNDLPGILATSRAKFHAISEVRVEKVVTKQKNEKKTVNLVSLPYYIEG